MQPITIRKWNSQTKSMEVVLSTDDPKFMLATGNTDSQGTPTFVGDIVEGTVLGEIGNLRKRGVVQFNKERMQFIIDFADLPTLWMRNGGVIDVKVIGNIFSTPELLLNENSI